MTVATLPEVSGLDRLAAQTALETYLNTTYHPDREWVDGLLLERFLGELPHSRMQSFFMRFFARFEEELNAEALPETRVQVSATRYRVPDVCLRSFGDEDELIVRTAPLLCIEILSREDRIIDLHEKLEDYRRMGVHANWIIDPWRREAFFVESNGDWRLIRDELFLPGTSVRVPVEEIFRALDPRHAPR